MRRMGCGGGARVSALMLAAALLLAPASPLPRAHSAPSSATEAAFGERWQLAQAGQPATSQPQLPVSLEQALYLIRSTLLTLNDANRSGNYSVLRDLAAPDFQSKNNAADLAQIFSDLRQRKVDLYAVALAAPQLSAPPAIDANRMLRLTGYFPTRPLQINFDMLFQNVNNQWRLFGISVATPEAPAADAAPKPEQPKPAAQPRRPPAR